MNAKKTLAFLLTLLMLVSLLSGFTVLAEEEPAPEPIVPDTTWYTSEEAGQEYTLTTPAQFLGFIQLITEKKTFEGQTVKIGADIDMTGTTISGKMSSSDADLGSTVEGKNFAAFGFMGTLDGQNHKIENITYDFYPSGARQHDMGLFGSIAEGKTAIIKNVALYGVMKPITNSTTPWRCGGLYALSRGTLICENVYNALDVYASAHVGAFVGRTTSDTAISRFTNCVVAGTVSANNSNTAQGVGAFAATLGGAEATFENCLVTARVEQKNASVERAAGFVCQLTAASITMKNNIYAGSVHMGAANTGRYYAWSVTDANVNKECINNLYVPNEKTSINSGSPKLMPLVTVAEDGTETVTFPEQTTPRYKVSKSRLTGVGAAATLASYGMTGWVATSGTPLPATIAEMLGETATVLTKDTDSVADYFGYQTKVDEATATGAVRLVGHVDKLDYEKVGVKYTVSYVENAETTDVTGTVDTKDVYTGLSGSETIYTNTQQEMPYSGEYFFTFTLEDIKTDIGDVLVFVETFHIANGAEVAGETFCFFVDWS